MNRKEMYEFSGGDVRFWIEDEGSIHLKAVSRHGDPTELSATEARGIAAALLKLADELDAID